MITLLYFAWVRERIGCAEETLSPPDLSNVGTLLTWLRAQGPGYADALADREAFRVAVNQSFVDDSAAVASGDEVAIFPPVTGG